MRLVNTDRFSNRSVDEAAAYWVMRLDAPGCAPSDRAAFEEWRRADAEHAEAYERARRALALVDRHLGSIELTDMGEQVFVETKSGHKSRFRRNAGAALAASLLLGAVLLFQLVQDPAPEQPVQVADNRFETAIGERSTVTLPDDSAVSLNTNTLVEVRFTQNSDTRQLVLVRGQAHFDVRKDPRPFEVIAGDRRVVAIGTAFDIRIDDELGVMVTLVEGRVSVEEDASEVDSTSSNLTDAGAHLQHRTVLEAGEQLIARPDRTEEVVLADIEQVVGWREGQLVFKNDPLHHVIREINRYSTEQIVIDDERVGALEIRAAAFTAGSTTKFVSAVEGMLPVKAQRVALDKIALVWEDEPGVNEPVEPPD